MTPLPPALVDVTVPDCFSPSALGSSGDCRLRLVISSLRGPQLVARLAAGPHAAVGALLHRVLERVALHASALPEEVFKQEYESTVEEIRRDPRRAHFAELASTRSLAEWARLKEWATSRAARMASATPPFDGSVRGRRRTAGSEIALESATLRLRGKADRIRQIGPRSFEIRDFKTGATLDEHGELKREIVLQLQAYGLMLLERGSVDDVRLIVDDGQEREVPFDTEARGEARDLLRQIMRAMPPAGRVSAAKLAAPGPSCWGCPIRHTCQAYKASAPEWWKEYPVSIERLSNDIWGTVLEVSQHSRIDILLRDEAGRRVRVDGLDLRHRVNPIAVGGRIWMFELEATGATKGFDGSRFHPRSFHELPRDPLERRAWALQLFWDPAVSSEAASLPQAATEPRSPS